MERIPARMLDSPAPTFVTRRATHRLLRRHYRDPSQLKDVPNGLKRRTTLTDAAAMIFDVDLGGRILSFHAGAASRYNEIVVARRRAGAPIEAFDALIAPTVSVGGAAVATRDVEGFAGCGVTLVNPREAS